MKICFVSDTLEPTEGPGRYAREIVAALGPRLAAAEVVLPVNHGAVDDARLEGCRLHRVLPSSRALSKRLALLPLAVAAARRALPIVRRADLVHALKDHPYSLIAAIASRLAGKPLVVTAYGTYSVLPVGSPFERALLRWVYRRAARVVTLGDYSRRRLEALAAAGKVSVIPPGVDGGSVEGEGQPAVAPVPEPFLLGVGQLKERKGFDLGVRAFRLIAAEFPGLRYCIAGDWGDEKYVGGLRDLIGADTDSIRLLGRVDSATLGWLYRHCELFLLTPRTDRAGHFEAYGLVYLEAGACGKAVIGARGCGAEDAIVDGRTGLLVAPDDVEELAGGLRRLLADRDLAAALGDEGRRRARELSWERAAERIASLYREVASPNP